MSTPQIDIKGIPDADSTADAVASAGGPRSVGRVIALLNFVARRAAGSSLTELSAALETPKSSLALLLRPLLAEGYLVRERNRYLLGAGMYNLAARIQNVRDPMKLLRPFLEELAERSEETVYVAVLDAQSRLAAFVDTIASSKMVRFVMPAGLTRPLYATAAGRVLLAYQNETWQSDYFDDIANKPETRCDLEVLQEELAAIREAGLMVSFEEAMDGGAAIAAPVYDPEGRIEAALVIAAPSARLRQNLPAFEEAIRNVTTRASALD